MADPDKQDEGRLRASGRLEAGKVYSFRRKKQMTFADYVRDELGRAESACPHVPSANQGKHRRPPQSVRRLLGQGARAWAAQPRTATAAEKQEVIASVALNELENSSVYKLYLV